MNNKKTVTSIRMYIRRDKLGDIYCIDYMYKNDDEIHNRKFEHNMDSANEFLKELYENVDVNFYHYNHTMYSYDNKNTTAYFFNATNTHASYHDHHFMSSCVGDEGRKVLKNAYKNMFDKKLKPSRARIQQELKNITFALGVSIMVMTPIVSLIYAVNKQEEELNKLKQTEQKLEQTEQKLQQIEQYIQQKKTDSLQNVKK